MNARLIASPSTIKRPLSLSYINPGENLSYRLACKQCVYLGHSVLRMAFEDLDLFIGIDKFELRQIAHRSVKWGDIDRHKTVLL